MEGTQGEFRVRHLGTPEAQAKLASAFCRARLKFEPVVHDRIGQYQGGRFPYATLGALTAATLNHLATEDVAVWCFPTDGIKREYRMEMHIAGHGARIEFGMDYGPEDAGGIDDRPLQPGERPRRIERIKESGKVQTYLMRYLLRAFGVLDSEPDADEDEDQTPIKRPEPRREAPRAEPRAARPVEPKAPPQRVQDLEKKLTTVAPTIPAPVAPPAQPEAAAAVDDGPIDQAMIDQIYEMREKVLGWDKFRFSHICLNDWGIDPKQIARSRKTAVVVLGKMQEAFKARGAQA